MWVKDGDLGLSSELLPQAPQIAALECAGFKVSSSAAMQNASVQASVHCRSGLQVCRHHFPGFGHTDSVTGGTG